MIEQVGPGFTMSETMVRSRADKLLEMVDFKVPVAVND
jgi:hypothetical protein